MPSYITLLNWTERGIANIKGSPGRLDAGREAFKKLGCELKDVYLTMGQYDQVIVCEAPDDETVAKITVMVAGRGNVASETMRAFTEDEYRKILAGLP